MNSEADERARSLYWKELVQLKHEAEYIQLYRARLTGILTWLDIGRAIISVGALGSWVGGLGYPKIWGSIIVASQVGEAVLDKLPLSARQKALVGFENALDTILIDALLEWENIQFDEVGGAQEITRRWHSLMKRRQEAEHKHLPAGLPFKPRLFKLAEQTTASYFQSQYGTKGIK